MAQERSLTPEKQLLNLIESPKAKDAAIRSNIAVHHGMRLFSFGVWRGKLSFFRDYFKKGFSGGFRQPDIKIINGFLAVVIVGLVFYLMNTFYFSIMRLNKIQDLRPGVQENTKNARFKELVTLQQRADYYLDKIRERDIFKIGVKKVVKDTGPATVTSKIIEATQHLKLVGISWSNDPDVMIEDTRALRTFFVKRGQMIGQVKIEGVFKNKVVLSYEGEEVELK